jgi:hypothetical protein
MLQVMPLLEEPASVVKESVSLSHLGIEGLMIQFLALPSQRLRDLRHLAGVNKARDIVLKAVLRLAHILYRKGLESAGPGCPHASDSYCHAVLITMPAPRLLCAAA